MTTAPNLDAILATIRKRESGGNYSARAPKGSASGAYQYVDGTWRSQLQDAGLGHLLSTYPSAYLAPKTVQDAVAAHNVKSILNTYGNDVSKVPVAWYYPAALKNPALLDTVPNPEYGNKQTIRGYANNWIKDYNKMGGNANSWTQAAWQNVANMANAGVAGATQPNPQAPQMQMAGVPTQSPQVNIMDVLAQALGLVQQTQPQQVDLSSYVQQVAAQRQSQLTDELATIQQMQQQAIDRIRAQYAQGQKGIAGAAQQGAADINAIGAMNTPAGQVTDIASQMRMLGYDPSAAMAQVAPDLATVAAQQAGTGQFLSGLSGGVQQGIMDQQGAMLAAMQAASVGDAQTAGMLQQLKARQASNAADQQFAQQMMQIQAQANIQNDQNRTGQLLQAIGAIGGLQQANAQLAQQGTGQQIDVARLQAQIDQNNVANNLNQQQLTQSAQQFALTYGLNRDELAAKLKQAGLDQKTAEATIKKLEAEAAYKQAQAEGRIVGDNPTRTKEQEGRLKATIDRNRQTIASGRQVIMSPNTYVGQQFVASGKTGQVFDAKLNPIYDPKKVSAAEMPAMEMLLAPWAVSYPDAVNKWLRDHYTKLAVGPTKTAKETWINNNLSAAKNRILQLTPAGSGFGLSPTEIQTYNDAFITG